MSRDDWITVALFAVVEGTPIVMLHDRVIDAAAFQWSVERDLRQMLHVLFVEIGVRQLAGAPAFMSVSSLHLR
jgi:hypothetical protein